MDVYWANARVVPNMVLLPLLSITLYQDRTYFLNNPYKINTNRTTTLSIPLLLINCSSVWLKCARGQCTEIGSWKPKAAPSWQHLFLGVHCCARTPPEIQQREALLREFRKVTSALSLPILQDLSLYMADSGPGNHLYGWLPSWWILSFA